MQVSSVQVAAVVMFYMTAALLMVFVNKAVMDSAPGLPLVFVFFQVVIAVILLQISSMLFKQVTLPRPDLHTAKKLTPVILIGVVGLVFNILCLRGVEASFFQIARGMQLPLTILVSSLATSSSPSKKVLAAAAVVTFGFFLGIAPSAAQPLKSTPSLVSLFYGFMSSLFIAIHAVLIKSALPHCGNSTIQLSWWSNAGAAVFIAPVIIFNGEHVTLHTLYTDGTWDVKRFIWGTAITGFVGFLLSIAGLLSVKVTSPITHMFSSAARSVLQTLLGVWLFKDYLSINRALSILVILGGTIIYTYIKSIESAAAPPKPSGSPLPPTSPYADKPSSKDDRDALPRHTSNNQPVGGNKFWSSPWSPLTPGFSRGDTNRNSRAENLQEVEELQRREKEQV